MILVSQDGQSVYFTDTLTTVKRSRQNAEYTIIGKTMNDSRYFILAEYETEAELEYAFLSFIQNCAVPDIPEYRFMPVKEAAAGVKANEFYQKIR